MCHLYYYHPRSGILAQEQAKSCQNQGYTGTAPNVPRRRFVYEALSLQGTLLLLLLPPEMALRRDTRGSSCHIYILDAKGRYAPRRTQGVSTRQSFPSTSQRCAARPGLLNSAWSFYETARHINVIYRLLVRRGYTILLLLPPL